MKVGPAAGQRKASERMRREREIDPGGGRACLLAKPDAMRIDSHSHARCDMRFAPKLLLSCDIS